MRQNKKLFLGNRQKKMVFFLFKFFLIFFSLQFLAVLLDFSFLENTLASWEGNWAQIPVFENRLLVFGTFFVVNAQCTGIVSSIILAAVIFSFNKPGLGKKTVWWLVGTMALFALNLVRLFLVLWVAKTHGLYWAEIAHQVSWFSTAVFILLIWLSLAPKMAGVKNLQELAE